MNGSFNISILFPNEYFSEESLYVLFELLCIFNFGKKKQAFSTIRKTEYKKYSSRPYFKIISLAFGENNVLR